jgi:Fz domain
MAWLCVRKLIPSARSVLRTNYRIRPLCVVTHQDTLKSSADSSAREVTSSATGKPSALVFYLCSMFVPVCPRDFIIGRRRGGRRRSTPTGPAAVVDPYDELIPPCRELCERVKTGCNSVLARYGIVWPADLDCATLPRHDAGVCISPDSIDNVVSADRSTKTTGECRA